MKTLKNWAKFNESTGDLAVLSLDIKNEYSKLKKGITKGSIILGYVADISKTDIHNIKQTYKDAIIEIIDDSYVLKLNNEK